MYRQERELSHVVGSHFEEILLQKGVNGSHIDAMKNTYVDSSKRMADRYEYCQNNVVQPVSTAKIIFGQNSMVNNCDRSLFDIATCNSSADLSLIEVTEAMSHIERDSLEELLRWYRFDCSNDNSINPIQLLYYEDEDVYDIKKGFYRCLYAKIIGVDFIQAQVTTCTKKKPEYRQIIASKDMPLHKRLSYSISLAMEWRGGKSR